VCTFCWSTGSLIPQPRRVPAATDVLPEIMSATELVKASWSEVPTCYRELRVGTKSLVLVSGPEGSGKSTMVIKGLDSVPGPVVFLSAEMKLGPQLGVLLARCGVKRESFIALGSVTVDQLHALLVRERTVALGVDSVQTAGIESVDMRHLLATTPLRVLFAVSQLNKQGDPHGVRSLAHECDVHLSVDEMRWRISKSRYQPVGVSGDVLTREAA
jgi:predicted ATP-dependent serine protease